MKRNELQVCIQELALIPLRLSIQWQLLFVYSLLSLLQVLETVLLLRLIFLLWPSFFSTRVLLEQAVLQDKISTGF